MTEPGIEVYMTWYTLSITSIQHWAFCTVLKSCVQNILVGFLYLGIPNIFGHAFLFSVEIILLTSELWQILEDLCPFSDIHCEHHLSFIMKLDKLLCSFCWWPDQLMSKLMSIFGRVMHLFWPNSFVWIWLN